MSKTRVCAAGAAAVLASVVASAGPSFAATSATPAAPKARTITEHYHGNTMQFDRNTWGGARNCAVADASNVYCFDNNEEFGAFTDRSSTEAKRAAGAAAPAATAAAGTCNGYAKIWDGANYTGRGLAFHNYGTSQNLADYAPVPFSLRSWFTNGQRSYAAMTNCYGWLLSSDQAAIYVTLHTNSQALSTAPTGVYYIRLNPGTG